MSLLIVGSVALDSIKTPFGEHIDIIGGSASHASVSASFFSPVNLVGVVGRDFPSEHFDFFRSRQINIDGLEIADGKTFRWSGYYEEDMNQAYTIATHLNVFADFDPKIPADYTGCDHVFLGNIHPALQLKVLDSMTSKPLVGMDTMNLWIDIERSLLTEVIKKVDFIFINDAEIRQYTGESNLLVAASRLIALGVKYVLLKKGEHGAYLISKDDFFALPAYPLKMLSDPTGAGDAFAGAFMGYLTKTGDFSIDNLKKALVYGTVLSSFTVEEFSHLRLKRLDHSEIIERYNYIKSITRFI